jgi:LacI family transcriptional regulator
VALLVEPANDFGRAIMRGVMRYANLQRRWRLFADLDSVLQPGGAWPRFDGAVFAGVPRDVFDYGRSRCSRVVRCSGAADPNQSAVVSLDDGMVGKQAAHHLIECRLERFAYYGSMPDYKTASKRLAGFTRALEVRGFSCLVCPVEKPTPQQQISREHRPRLISWLRELRKPIGIMAFDDTTAHDLAESCLEAGIAVPDQVAIVGVNNDDLICESAWPPLSSVEGGAARIGYAAAKLLDRMLSGEVLATDQRVITIPPLGVVQRQSTSVLAVEDPHLAEAVRFIREHACDPCSVQDVLRVVPVGRRWLERKFSAQLGRTPHEEIIRVRIETAQRLLLQPDLSLAEVVERCGYACDAGFHIAFRKRVGTTPAAYRRSARAAAES